MPIRRIPVILVILSALATTAQDAPSQPPPDDYFSRVRPAGEETRNAAKDAMEGKAPPTIQAVSWSNSDALSWEALRGKVVVIDFWGVWCGPCRKALPKLQALDEKHREDGLVIIGIHTKEEAALGKKFVEAGNLAYPVAFDDDDKTAAAFRISGYPAYYAVDREGVLRFADFQDYELDGIVEKLLGEPPPAQLKPKPRDDADVSTNP